MSHHSIIFFIIITLQLTSKNCLTGIVASDLLAAWLGYIPQLPVLSCSCNLNFDRTAGVVRQIRIQSVRQLQEQQSEKIRTVLLLFEAR